MASQDNKSYVDPITQLEEKTVTAQVQPDGKSAMGNNVMTADRIAQIKAEADRRRAAAAPAMGPSTQGKRSAYMTALSNDMVYRKALDMYNQATWRGGMTDEQYQWLFDNRGAITQAALSKHGGQTTPGFMNDRMIQTLRHIGSGKLGKNVVRPLTQAQQQAAAADAARQEQEKVDNAAAARLAVFGNRGRGGNAGTHNNGDIVSTGGVNEHTIPQNNNLATTPGGPQQTGSSRTLDSSVSVELLDKNKGGGTGPYNPNPSQVVRVTPFAGSGRRDAGGYGNLGKGYDTKGGPGPDPNISVTDSQGGQINSQRAGNSGNRRFTPFSGNGPNNQLRGG